MKSGWAIPKLTGASCPRQTEMKFCSISLVFPEK